MYIGPFYLDIKELLLILTAIIVGVALYFHLEIYLFNSKALFTILILILITKGLLPAIHNEAFFILAVMAIFLTLYIPIFQVTLFYFITFLLFKLLKVV